eukprot:scaffold1033_cov408-Prasinococcus_capsulatus_cf.AAC.35
MPGTGPGSAGDTRNLGTLQQPSRAPVCGSWALARPPSPEGTEVQQLPDPPQLVHAARQYCARRPA